MITYLIYKFMHRIALTLPKKWGYWIAERVADLLYLFRSNLRNAVFDNIRHILVNKTNTKTLKYQKRIYAKRVFRNFSKSLVDFLVFSKFNRGNISDYVKIRHLDYVDEAYNKNKGVIGVTAHLGHWELSGAALAMLGYKINVVALDHENTKINRFFVNQRLKIGEKVIPVGANSRRYLEVLKRNELIALVGDRLTSKAGIETEFFGKKTFVPRGPAVLSLRTGAPILPGFMIRTENDTFELVFEKPIYVEQFIDPKLKTMKISREMRKKTLHNLEKEITKKIISILEKYITLYPYQWFLFYKVWK